MAEKKISPKAPAGSGAKKSGAQAATRVTKVSGQKVQKIKRVRVSRANSRGLAERPGSHARPGLIAYRGTTSAPGTSLTTLAPWRRPRSATRCWRGWPGRPCSRAPPTSTISRLAAQGVTRRFRRGTYLFHQGDDAPDVYFLVSGRVEISSLSSNGHRQLHTTLDAPQFFGELGVLGDQPRSAAALALEDSEVWRAGGPGAPRLPDRGADGRAGAAPGARPAGAVAGGVRRGPAATWT